MERIYALKVLKLNVLVSVVRNDMRLSFSLFRLCY